jgi:hypothetical protein
MSRASRCRTKIGVLGTLNIAGDSDSLGQVNVKVLDEQGVKILKKLTVHYCERGK